MEEVRLIDANALHKRIEMNLHASNPFTIEECCYKDALNSVDEAPGHRGSAGGALHPLVGSRLLARQAQELRGRRNPGDYAGGIADHRPRHRHLW